MARAFASLVVFLCTLLVSAVCARPLLNAGSSLDLGAKVGNLLAARASLKADLTAALGSISDCNYQAFPILLGAGSGVDINAALNLSSSLSLTNITLLIPSNSALLAAAAATASANTSTSTPCLPALAANPRGLQALLRSHIILGRYSLASLSALARANAQAGTSPPVLPTLSGDSLKVSLTAGGQVALSLLRLPQVTVTVTATLGTAGAAAAVGGGSAPVLLAVNAVVGVSVV